MTNRKEALGAAKAAYQAANDAVIDAYDDEAYAAFDDEAYAAYDANVRNVIAAARYAYLTEIDRINKEYPQ